MPNSSDSKRNVHDVVIIGGGVAGLSAAQDLLSKGCDNICVLEAQARLGGRVKQVSGIVPWELDAGAELVHGQDSTIALLLTQSLKADLKKMEYPNYVYWPDSGAIECACGGEGEYGDGQAVKHTFDLIEQLAEERLEDVHEDTTAAEWFQGRCGDSLTRSVLPLLDAFYANDLCSDLRSLGAAEAAWEARQWSDGEDTLVKGGTMAPLTAALARGVPVRLSAPVSEVRWRPQGVPWSGADGAHTAAAAEVVGMNGEVVLARTVICAAPLTQLQKRALRFSPAPGRAFNRVLQAARVHNAVKLWAVFRIPFWETAPRLRRAVAAAEEGSSPAVLGVDSTPSCTGSEGTVVDEPGGLLEADAESPTGAPVATGPRMKPARPLASSSATSQSMKSMDATCSSDDFSSSDDDAPDAAPPASQEGAGGAGTSEFWNMLCPESPIPEFWVPQHAPDGLEGETGMTAVGAAQGASGCTIAGPVVAESVHVLQGFACAGKADALSRLGAEAAVQVFIDQLDRIFGDPDEADRAGGFAPGKGAPASSAFLRGGLMDWSQEPFVEGGYSSPSPGVAPGARATLQALPGGTVFFAGEHTHERLNACLQGAMETGVNAAARALHSVHSTAEAEAAE